MNEAKLRDDEMTVAVPDRIDAGLLFIGVLSTPWREVADCPRQGDAEAGPSCRIEIAEPWPAALSGIGVGDALDVLYWLGEARRDLVVQHPRGRPDLRGTFAIRSPHRPNPIGLSTVRVDGVEPAALVVRGLDCLDGTPLVDIKPRLKPISGA